MSNLELRSSNLQLVAKRISWRGCFAYLALLVFPLVLLAQAPALPPEVPREATRYVIFLAGNRAGASATWTGPDGARHGFFEFNDRGRGPLLKTRVVLNDRGLPTSVAVVGHDYYKGPVEERFILEGQKASWKNKGEQGEKVLHGDAFYVCFLGAPEEAGLLAQALLRAPGGQLALLPEGQASIERVGEVKAGAARSATAVQYDILGLDFAPTPVWLDADQNFIAAGNDWFAAVREGWEANWPALLMAQKNSRAARAARLAKSLGRKPSSPLVIQHAKLFDSEAAATRAGTTVVISGNRIQAVGPDGSVNIPSGAEIIDAGGKTLLPGLWDMHVHLQDTDGILDIANGVTSVRDLGNDSDMLLALRKQFDSGEAIGPRVVLAGLIDGRGPYQGPTKVFADTPEEARSAVDRYKALGYEQIKIYSSVKPEIVPVIIEQAHKDGLRVSGHIPAFMTAEQGVKLGYDEIQHINFLFLNFLDSVQDTRTPVRFTAVAEHGAELDLGSERVQAFVRLLQQRKTVIDPTLNIFEEMFTARPGVPDPAFAAVASRMPPQVRRGFLAGGLPVPEGMDARYRDSFAATLKMVALLYKSGIPIVAGTDALNGFALHRELELYIQAGIPAPVVLQFATLGAARVMKHDSDLGSIAPGKLADLVLVDGDPVSRISDVRRVTTVVKDGVVYQTAALDQAIGVAPLQ